jgi:hypothetical protein
LAKKDPPETDDPDRGENHPKDNVLTGKRVTEELFERADFSPAFFLLFVGFLPNLGLIHKTDEEKEEDRKEPDEEGPVPGAPSTLLMNDLTENKRDARGGDISQGTHRL